MSVRRLKAIVSYLGGEYVGWERQLNGLAVQEVLEDAILRITREEIVVDASGRTDAGVHAEGQVVSFSLRNPMPLRKLRLGLNAVLPPDVSVLEVEEVSAHFHARFCATSKLYRYRVLNHPAPWPLLDSQSYHVYRPLDLEAMRKGARLLVGTHDFTAFAKEAWRKKNRVRTVLRAELIPKPPEIFFEFEATGFLYNMVRIMVGTLLEIGAHKRSVESIAELLEAARPRGEAGYTVPAEGLVLVKVNYPPAEDSPGSPAGPRDSW